MALKLKLLLVSPLSDEAESPWQRREPAQVMNLVFNSRAVDVTLDPIDSQEMLE